MFSLLNELSKEDIDNCYEFCYGESLAEAGHDYEEDKDYIFGRLNDHAADNLSTCLYFHTMYIKNNVLT